MFLCTFRLGSIFIRSNT